MLNYVKKNNTYNILRLSRKGNSNLKKKLKYILNRYMMISDIDVLYKKRRKKMNAEIEIIPSYHIAYIRNVDYNNIFA